MFISHFPIHNLKIHNNRKWMVTREAHGAYRAGNLMKNALNLEVKNIIFFFIF